jgi:cell division protein FtsI (penicillin-binding protein 3)
VIAERVLAEGFRQHRPAGISCVVVVPQTGEILAMANLPNFDPNRYGESTPQGRRNRAITDAYEPGSTFKALSIASALEAGVITLAHRVDCEQGAYRYRHRVLHDLHPYGTLDIISVIAKSSNIGAAKIGQALGEADLYAGLKRFGIGDPTGIPLPAESPGLLRPLERWVKHDSILSIPMGHEVMATPLQMTMAMAAIANQGRLMRPLLVRQVVKESGEVVAQCGPQVRRQAISAAVAQQMTQALTAVVDGEGGTGPQARLEAYSVAGKTGTAEKWKNGRPSDGHFASFIGFFPAEAPRLCIGVFVDEPRGGTHFGGTTAAPLFREIATQAAAYLGIPSSPSKVEPIRAAELAQGTGRSRLTPGTGRARM